MKLQTYSPSLREQQDEAARLDAGCDCLKSQGVEV